MTSRDWVTAVAEMRRSHGMATRTRIRSLGVSERMIQRRLADGLLLPVNRWVLALPGTNLDLAASSRAAVLALPSAIPTGPAAAALLGHGPWEDLDLGTEPWLIHPRSRGVAARYLSHPGARTLRRGDLIVAHPKVAVIDLIRFWPTEESLHLAERALQMRAVTLEDLASAHAALTRCSGNRALGRILSELADGTRSVGERQLVQLLRNAGITGWVANHRVSAGGRWYELDVAFPSGRLAIEFDGRAFHSDARAFQRDRRRQNDLIAAGWTVLRFTWADLAERPEEVIARIEAALRHLAA
jgi:very-short-patch-repair endonuclease